MNPPDAKFLFVSRITGEVSVFSCERLALGYARAAERGAPSEEGVEFIRNAVPGEVALFSNYVLFRLVDGAQLHLAIDTDSDPEKLDN